MDSSSSFSFLSVASTNKIVDCFKQIKYLINNYRQVKQSPIFYIDDYCNKKINQIDIHREILINQFMRKSFDIKSILEEARNDCLTYQFNNIKKDKLDHHLLLVQVQDSINNNNFNLMRKIKLVQQKNCRVQTKLIVVSKLLF